MTARIHFAVLAHANAACVADLVRSLWDLHPTSTVSVFNGGKDRSFFTDQAVAICPNSAPLRYGNLTAFHIGVMRWLSESGADYDFLVTLDHDMMPIRPGLADLFAGTMSEVSYMGARFREASDPATWPHGGPTVAAVNAHWKQRWQPLFGTQVPYWSFNPGQVFSRGLVERMLAFAGVEPLMTTATRSRIFAIEEIVYPTLAVAVGAETHGWRGERGMVFGGHTLEELRDFGSDPDVYFVHRVHMQLGAPDRLAIHDLYKDLPSVAREAPPQQAAWVDPRRGPGLRGLKARARASLREHYGDWHVKHRG